MLHLQTIHNNTPTLAAIDPRGMVARAVQYDCAGAAGTAQTRVDRTVHDAAGHAVELWDPRLFVLGAGPSNSSNIYSLSGAILASRSVDAGLHISLFGEEGQPVLGWDGRGSQCWMRYDKQLRLSELYEQAAGGDSFCAERLTYAANDQVFADRNQCGQLIRHEDPAGVLLCNDYGLNGAALEQERRLASQETEGFITRSRFNPSGELVTVTDARGNYQRFHQTLDGSLRAVEVRLDGTLAWLPIVRTVTYNTHAQVEQEVAGNGVITTLEYGAEDGRLKRLLSRLDTNAPLQDLHYTYDPVGNVLSIEDAALPIRFFANQRIEPISHFLYDTLYRLVQATGWEAGAVKHGPSASQTADPAMPGNYRQTYHYDAGNNLLELTHLGAQDPGHRLVADPYSNRCLPVRDGVEPGEDDFRDGFDANGNSLHLQPGQTLSWDVRNQLREVRPVERNGVDDDIEKYEYGANGMRVRKVRSLQSGSQTNLIETRYLPGLQIRTHSGTDEELHVIEVSTGRGSVRVLHWKAGKPKDIPNNQQRYSLTDHLGSSTLELDQHANIITQERYYPFGGTAWSSGEAVQVSYKVVRYSGKERDATGLYYYGFRYYIAWLQRWVNPDPAGDIDGLNIFAFVRDNPIRYKDANGLGLESTNNVRDYLVSKRGQDVSVDVDTFKKFFFMAKLSGSRVSVLDEATGNYESTDEFQVVEVGVGSREELLRRNPRGVIASDEVKSTINIYGLKYTSLMIASSHRWFERRQWGEEAARQRGNFAAGEYVSRHFSNWLVLGERTRQMDVDFNGAPDNRLFALIKKTDLVKEPSERTIYGISMISVTRKDDGSNEADLNVDYTIVHPDAQITRSHADSSDAGASTGALRLRGAGTFLTMNAINLVSKTVNMKTINTSAINPRSAAMAMGWGEASPF